jgi:hypothetical protein
MFDSFELSALSRQLSATSNAAAGGASHEILIATASISG